MVFNAVTLPIMHHCATFFRFNIAHSSRAVKQLWTSEKRHITYNKCIYLTHNSRNVNYSRDRWPVTVTMQILSHPKVRFQSFYLNYFFFTQILSKWNNSTATLQGQVKGHIIRPTPPWNAVAHHGHADANWNIRLIPGCTSLLWPLSVS